MGYRVELEPCPLPSYPTLLPLPSSPSYCQGTIAAVHLRVHPVVFLPSAPSFPCPFYPVPSPCHTLIPPLTFSFPPCHLHLSFISLPASYSLLHPAALCLSNRVCGHLVTLMLFFLHPANVKSLLPCHCQIYITLLYHVTVKSLSPCHCQIPITLSLSNPHHPATVQFQSPCQSNPHHPASPWYFPPIKKR